ITVQEKLMVTTRTTLT
nr:immunoglobulin heavy chain junction region [Mus musculus]